MRAASETPAEVVRYVSRIHHAIAAVAPVDVVGTYIHGSAVLGGFVPRASDVDVLAVISDSLPGQAQEEVATAVRQAAHPCPGIGLELSVINSATARELGDCLFEVHVSTVQTDEKVVLGHNHAGDPDLILHVAVCRLQGREVFGPPAETVFGVVPPQRIIRALLDELRWGPANASEAYAVLNACRSIRYLHEGILCSKVDGAKWMLARGSAPAVVSEALAQQLAGIKVVPPSHQAKLFVEESIALLQATP
jgi:Domain of unknown function (DUF4111)